MSDSSFKLMHVLKAYHQAGLIAQLTPDEDYEEDDIYKAKRTVVLLDKLFDVAFDYFCEEDTDHLSRDFGSTDADLLEDMSKELLKVDIACHGKCQDLREAKIEDNHYVCLTCGWCDKIEE